MSASKDLALPGHDEEPQLLNVADDFRMQPHRTLTALVSAAVVIVSLLLLLFGNHNDDGFDWAPAIALVLAAVGVVLKIVDQTMLRRWGAIKRSQIP